ncbi:hypothetical protein ACFL16_03660 [Patescibacteria group bacterium]
MKGKLVRGEKEENQLFLYLINISESLISLRDVRREMFEVEGVQDLLDINSRTDKALSEVEREVSLMKRFVQGVKK